MEQSIIFGPAILAKPAKGGATRNLGNIVIKRLASWDSETLTPAHQDNQHGKTSHRKSEDSQLAATITNKPEARIVPAAIRLLCSDDTLAPATLETLEALKQKYPNTPENRRQPSEFRGNLRFQALQISPEDMIKNLKTFPAGSSGRPDGITPQQLLDLLTGPPDGTLKTVVTKFTNITLSGNLLQPIREDIF